MREKILRTLDGETKNLREMSREIGGQIGRLCAEIDALHSEQLICQTFGSLSFGLTKAGKIAAAALPKKETK